MIIKKEGFRLIMKSFIVISIFILSSLFVSAACENGYISSCQTLTGKNSYCLSADLNSATTCITFDSGATSHELDCQGHSISRSAADGYVVDIQNGAEVTLKNCIINGSFSYGIYVGSSTTTIENITMPADVTTTGGGIATGSSTSNVNIRDSTISLTGSSARSIWIQGTNSRVYDSVIETGAQQQKGVMVTGNNNDVYNNNITGGNFDLNVGVFLETSDNSEVYGNDVSGFSNSNAYGIRIYQSDDNIIRDNTISGNGHAIKFDNSAENRNQLINNDMTSNSQTISTSGGGTNNNVVIYNNSYAQVFWNESDLGDIDVEHDLSIGSTIFLEQNLVGYASSSSGDDYLNGTAHIEFRGVSWGEGYSVAKDGVRCDDTSVCNVSYSAGVLYANISSFSNYTLETPPPVPEFEDYAMIFLLVTVIGGFLVIRNKQE